MPIGGEGGGGGGGTKGNLSIATIASELNRIANGSYPTPDKYLGDNKAANVIAGTSNKEVIEALNKEAGITNPSLFKDLNAICNLLAGTTGLEAHEALCNIRA